MKLLISVIDEEEAKDAVNGGAEIIDVKNPFEGSMGASFPRIIKQIRKQVPKEIEVSAAIGDFPFLPGLASLAALGATLCGVDYVKIGLCLESDKEAYKLLTEARLAVKSLNPLTKVVAVGFADYKENGYLNPLHLPDIAKSVGIDAVMIDTKNKGSGKKLFDFLKDEELNEFTRKAHKHNLIVGLAGSLGEEDIKRVWMIGADVIGIRGYACIEENRRGRIERERVARLKKAIEEML